MSRQWLSIPAAVLAAVAIPCPGQAVKPAPATVPQPTSTIEANTNLVVVDVVVTDAQHHPVHKLAQSDFIVRENGKPQTVRSFEEHKAAATAALPPVPKLPPGTFTNFTNAPADSPLNILLLDALNTPMAAQADVRSQMLKYLKTAPAGTRMAVFGLTTRLVLLQGFTSDPELLRALLSSRKGSAKGSPLLNDPLNGDNPGADDPLMDTAEDVLGNDPNGAELLANMQQFEADIQAFQLQMRARMTLDALNTLAHYLSGLPGRKNVIWFSGSFPINILPDGDLKFPFNDVASCADEFRDTTDLLSRAQVAVYPIDARGLVTEPMMNAQNSGGRYARNPANFAKDSVKFFQQNSSEHGTMQQMAEDTGGEAFVNTNGLKEAVAKAVEAGSNYYTIAYTPTNQKWNGDYRNIQVELARKGLTLSYRRGYYADDPDRPQHSQETKVEGNGQASSYNPMRLAMMRGGPEPTEIVLATSIRRSTDATEDKPVAGNMPAPKASGPYQRYTVVISVDPHALDCPAAADQSRTCSLDVATFVYDPDGALKNSVMTGLNARIPPDRVAAVLRSGIRFRQEISVPAKGESFLRIGVHDARSGRIGAVEVPVSAIAKLPPLAVTGGSKPAATAGGK